jgi:sialate O-acetylesterase
MNKIWPFQALSGLVAVSALFLCGGCGGGSGGLTPATVPTTAPTQIPTTTPTTAPTQTPATSPTTPAVSRPRVVACVGDSLTEAYYPPFLASRLGSGFTVLNFGKARTTMRKSGASPYWDSPVYGQALASRADIVVIMLGTNDDVDLPSSQQEFVSNYKEMIGAFKNANPNSMIYACLPPPVYERYDKMEHTNRFIRQAATESGTPLIDVHTALSDKPELFPDRYHPNDQGAELIAAEIHRVLSAQGL